MGKPPKVKVKSERIALAALRKIKRVGLQGSGSTYERTEEGEIAFLALKRIGKLAKLETP